MGLSDGRSPMSDPTTTPDMRCECGAPLVMDRYGSLWCQIHPSSAPSEAGAQEADCPSSEKQLAERVRVLEEALRPFAALAEDVDRFRHEDDSTCPHRLKAGDLRRARKALSGGGE